MGDKPLKKRYIVLKYCAIIASAGILLGILAFIGLYLYIAPKLPDPKLLEEVELQEPLRVYSQDGKLMSEFGDMRRVPIDIADIPKRVQHAFIASEDDRFYKHPGVDYQGLIRAAFKYAMTGQKKQGGSTITMQVSRNFFLSKERTFTRKFNEIFLSLKMERTFTKDEILELYLNKIFLGKRAHGVVSAAQVYYGASLDELTIAQTAMIAGLPKAPSRFNPIINPDRALLRRNYVLGRMEDLGYISEEEYKVALDEPLSAKEYKVSNELNAPYVAEMARAFIQEHFKEEDVYNQGIKIYTTIQSAYQQAANDAVYKGVLNYEQRRGYIGAAGDYADVKDLIKAVNSELADKTDPTKSIDADIRSAHKKLDEYPGYGPLEAAIVLKVEEKKAIVYNGENGLMLIPWDGLKWAKVRVDVDTFKSDPHKASDVVKQGQIVYIRTDKSNDGESYYALSQMPKVESALVSLDPQTGATLALVGGFDYFKNKFNRAVQSERQPGSSFKPFLYTAGLDNGYTPASIINDAPVVFDYPELEGRWKPENYSGRFYGPTRLREGLVKSRNLISIRLLIGLGIKKTRSYIRRFGFKNKSMPYDLSLALGSGTVSPMELANAYSIFANGGYKVKNYLIDRIEDRNGKVIYYSDHSYVCPECVNSRGKVIANKQLENAVPVAETDVDKEPPLQRANLPAKRVLKPQTAFLIDSILNEVTIRGTGARASRILDRRDLAGKTGTTNDQNDAWFSGYHKKAVAVVWAGYDEQQPMGEGETGTGTALPIWIDYMQTVLENEPKVTREQPEGIVEVEIDKETGLLASSSDSMTEYFKAGEEPTETQQPDDYTVISSDESGAEESEELF